MTSVATEEKRTKGGSGRSGVSDGSGRSPGLGARLAQAMDVLSSVVAELDPDCVGGKDATDLYASFAGLERLAVAGKTLLAPRIESSLVWRDTGHRNAAVLLADLEGVSTGQAGATLSLGRRLEALPGTQDELRKGTLSTPKVAELVDAGVVDPGRELDLVAGAADAPLKTVRERCRKSRATAAGTDPLAAVRRIHASRRFTSWTDADGAFCYQGRDTADRGARILSRLGSAATCLRQAAKKSGAQSEADRAYMADAFHALLTESTGVSSGPGETGPTEAASAGENSSTEAPSGRTGSAEDPSAEAAAIDRPRPARWWSGSTWLPSSGAGPIPGSAVPSTTSVPSRSPWPGPWPTTPTCATSSTRPATSGPSPTSGAPSTALCAPPSSTGTRPVWSPAVGSRPASRSTTSSPSPRADQPPSTIWPGSATTTISSRPTKDGTSSGPAPPKTAPPSGPLSPHPLSDTNRASGSTAPTVGRAGAGNRSESPAHQPERERIRTGTPSPSSQKTVRGTRPSSRQWTRLIISDSDQ